MLFCLRSDVSFSVPRIKFAAGFAVVLFVGQFGWDGDQHERKRTTRTDFVDAQRGVRITIVRRRKHTRRRIVVQTEQEPRPVLVGGGRASRIKQDSLVGLRYGIGGMGMYIGDPVGTKKKGPAGARTRLTVYLPIYLVLASDSRRQL
jgi:hypothetical protein